MDDFSELEGRITAALDRIGLGLEALARPMPPPEADTSEIDRLTAELEDERTANAQLEERVRAIKDKQDRTVEVLSDEVDRLRTLLASEEKGLARLRRVNAELRANNDALRAAIAEQVAEPHLVNKSMMAELEALRATQAADRDELDAVLGELIPLVGAAEADAEEGADA
jgi:chromosome segregation ATPase